MLLERAAKSAHSLLKPKREKEASELPSPDRCFVWGSRLHKVYDTNSDGRFSRAEVVSMATDLLDARQRQPPRNFAARSGRSVVAMRRGHAVYAVFCGARNVLPKG